MSSFVENINKVAGITVLQEVAEITSEIKTVSDNMDDVKNASTISEGLTNIIYGVGEPTANINPFNGTNAIYVNTENNFNYLCSDATPDANVWIKSTSGQFLGQSKVGAVMFSSKTTDENLVLPDGQNGLIVDSLEVTGNGSIEIQGDAVLVTV